VIIVLSDHSYREVADKALEAGVTALRDYGMAPACGLASAAPTSDAYLTAVVTVFRAIEDAR
jgi:hypothetical protein